MLEQGVVQELHVERASARGLVGNIYLGRVARVLPGMQSAFVEIGLERAAFLHIADIWEHRQNGHGGSDSRPIEKILHEGQALLVQVIKDPIGTKGARLSTQVSASPAACSSTCRRIRTSASRSASRTRPSAKACATSSAPAAGGLDRRLHHPHDGRDRHRARDAERHRVPDQAVGRPQRPRARRPGAGAALPGPEPRAARAARHGDRGDAARRRRLARDLRRRCRTSPASTRRRWSTASRTTPASGRCSTSTASRTRSRRRSAAASTSSPAAT